jgi:hypothetical protein
MMPFPEVIVLEPFFYLSALTAAEYALVDIESDPTPFGLTSELEIPLQLVEWLELMIICC